MSSYPIIMHVSVGTDLYLMASLYTVTVFVVIVQLICLSFYVCVHVRTCVVRVCVRAWACVCVPASVHASMFLSD